MRFFVHLWDRGWIYRAERIVNWCPFHETAISDLEVEHVDMDDTLTYARYPFADGSGHITIATVRPATMLADVAVAVHPDDERYRDAVGKEVLVPYVERAVPVIADARVEPEFGTGALKITPGHDPTDFEIGRDHGLPIVTVIGPDGRMNENAGDLAGKTQQEADEAILAWLKEHDRLEQREHYRHAVGTCERCHTGSSRSSRCSGGWRWRSRASRRSRRSRSAASATTPSRSTSSRSARSRRSRTGTSRGSSGGATSSRSGTARTATSPARGRRPTRAPSAARPSSSATRTCSTRGSRPRSGRTPRSAGRSGRPSSSATTRATSTRPRARSSASGRTG